MTQTKRTLRRLVSFPAFLILAMPVVADDYVVAVQDVFAAYKAQDFATMEQAAKNALVARPLYPTALYYLSMAQVLGGNPEASLATLTRLADMQVMVEYFDNPAYEAVLGLPANEALKARFIQLQQPAGTPEIAYQLEDGQFVPEGIALKGDELYLGSIRNGRIVRHSSSTETIIKPGDAGTQSIFGMRATDDGLWFTSAAMDQFIGPESDLSTGLYFYEFEQQRVMHQEAAPVVEGRQAFGDLLLDGDKVFVSDQLDGRIYRYSISAGEFEQILDKGPLKSPQGMAFNADKSGLYVAGWNHGLHYLDLDSGEVQRVSAPDSVSTYGADGLYRHGHWLIAIQNGIQPNRVVAWRLSNDGMTISESRILAMNHPEFDEPNLGTVHNGAFYFIANSHWNRFDRENQLPEDLSGPIVMKVVLPESD